jgi:hypothetical protein
MINKSERKNEYETDRESGRKKKINVSHKSDTTV